jgi:hypothetical protein
MILATYYITLNPASACSSTRLYKGFVMLVR